MTTPASGNRWEPPAGATPEGGPPVYVDPGTAAPAARTVDTNTSSRRTARLPRLRLWLVAVGAAFFLAGGVGGFVAGHAAAGHGSGTAQLTPADDHGPRPGFDSDGRRTGRDPFGDDQR